MATLWQPSEVQENTGKTAIFVERLDECGHSPQTSRVSVKRTNINDTYRDSIPCTSNHRESIMHPPGRTACVCICIRNPTPTRPTSTRSESCEQILYILLCWWCSRNGLENAFDLRKYCERIDNG